MNGQLVPLGADILVLHKCGYRAILRRLESGPYLRHELGGLMLCCPGCGTPITAAVIDQEWQPQLATSRL